MKNKILALSIIFILISFILFFSNTCFASELSYPNFDSVLDSSYSHYGYVVWLRDGEYQMALVSANSADTIKNLYVTTEGNVHYGYYKSVVGDAHYSRYYYSNGSWILSETATLTEGKLVNQRLGWSGLVDSTFTIYNYTDGTVFFQPPVQEITLAQVLEQNSPTQIFKSQMKNVLVSLTVFLVGLVAFWKAWAWLKTQLRQA